MMNTKIFMLAAALAISAGTAVAQEAVKIGSIEISGPWARATPKGASVAAGYLKLTNTGSEADRLVGGSSEFSSRIEVHEMSMDKGVMRMRPVANGLEIKPGQSVELKPNSYHLMFVGLKRQLKQGEKVRGTLKFEKAGSADVEFAVEPVGSPGPGAASSGHMQMQMH